MTKDIEKEMKDCVIELCNESDQSEFHRYKSMIYCFKFFQENIIGRNPDEKVLDLAALNLATYLSSWGMYRGSSFLLRCNYKVFVSLIDKLKNFNFDPYNIEKNDPKIVVECFNCIKEYLTQVKLEYSIKKHPTEIIRTTLITKIMLGIFGITPAFDKYFVQGLSVHPELKFTKTWYQKVEKFELAYENLLTFYKDYKSVITELSEKNLTAGCKIPPMRVVDIYFWKLGKK